MKNVGYKSAATMPAYRSTALMPARRTCPHEEGVLEEELVGRTDHDLDHPDRLDPVPAVMRCCAESA